jgi:saccharopine dehydrogenase-like NADP-dependent oxidoreductase
MEAYAGGGPGSVKDRIARLLDQDVDSPVMEKLEWLGLFRKTKIHVANATPALILEDLLLKKWALKPSDKDMIIMHHEFEYILENQTRLLKSTLVMKGANEHDTAMARLVGLPIGIFVRLVMEGKIKATGVNIPVMQEVYDPVLEELATYGVVFREEETIL